MATTFPETITNLPRANVPIEGVTAYLFQGENHQIVFMQFDRDVQVPLHAHGAQWAVVLDGEIDLTIGELERTYRMGDTYFIPAGVQHSARIGAGYTDVTLFEDRDRYKPR